MKTLVHLLAKLKPEELDKLIQQVKAQRPISRYVDTCPICSSGSIVKNGSFKTKDGDRRSRYKCKACNKIFNEFTGTSLFYIKKYDRWNEFVELTMDGFTVREIADKLELNTHTVFNWRHKLLASFESVFLKNFKGIVEMDEFHLKFSQKGRRSNFIKIGKTLRGDNKHTIKVLAITDRDNTLDLKITKKGRTSAKDLKRIMPIYRFDEDCLMIADKHRSYKRYFRENGLAHETILSKEYVRGIYHIQRANSLINEFKRWLKWNFIGVSTKYLQNYLNLYLMIKILKGERNKVEKFIEYTFRDNLTYLRSKIVEEKYQVLLTKSEIVNN